jgi:hypothetical protein
LLAALAWLVGLVLLTTLLTAALLTTACAKKRGFEAPSG